MTFSTYNNFYRISLTVSWQHRSKSEITFHTVTRPVYIKLSSSCLLQICLHTAGVSNSNTQWAKIKKSVLVEGRTGSMFIAKLIEMNLLHILNLELTQLQKNNFPQRKNQTCPVVSKKKVQKETSI